MSLKHLQRVMSEKATESWSGARMYQQTFGMNAEAPLPPVEIDENTMILGFKSKDFSRDNVQIMRMNRVQSNGEKNTFTFACIGVQGTGKTRMAKNIVLDNGINRFKEKWIIIDPQKEWFKSKEPNPDNTKKGDELLEELNVPDLKRRGYNLVTVSPWKLPYKSEVKYKTLITDILEAMESEPDEALRMTAELLGIDLNDVNALDVIRLCLKTKLETWGEFVVEVNKLKEKHKNGVGTVLRKLYFARKDNIITDNPGHGLKLFELIKKYEGVIFETSMRGSDQPGYIETQTNAALKIQLFRFVWDMEKHNKFHRHDSILKLDWAGIFLDEVGQLAGKVITTMCTFVINLVAKMRKAGIHLGIADQSFSRVADALFEQIKNVFSSQMTEANSSVFKARGMKKRLIEYLEGLVGRIRTTIGTEVVWWFVHTEEGDVLEFLPGYLLSDSMRR